MNYFIISSGKALVESKRQSYAKTIVMVVWKWSILMRFISALKTTWLRKLITDNSRWIIILQSTVNIQTILNLGTSYIIEKILPKIKNKFWTDVFLSHMQVSTRNTPTEIQQFQTNPIFFNENIKIGNKTIYNKSCVENGIKYINDITKEDGNIYTYDELNYI